MSGRAMADNEKVIDLGGHDRMTPEEALVVASRDKWDKVLICGYQGREFICITSEMSMKDVLWYAEMLRRDATSPEAPDDD